MNNSQMLVERARNGHCGFNLPASGILSPYFQLKHCPVTEGRRSRGAGRDIQLIEVLMAVNKAIVLGYVATGSGPMVAVAYYDGDTYETSHASLVDMTGVATTQDAKDAAENAVNAYATTQEWTLTSIVWGS